MEDEVLIVKVGGGKKAHHWLIKTDNSIKSFELRDGGYAFGRAVCGAGGKMVLAEDGLELCARCEEITGG